VAAVKWPWACNRCKHSVGSPLPQVLLAPTIRFPLTTTMPKYTVLPGHPPICRKCGKHKKVQQSSIETELKGNYYYVVRAHHLQFGSSSADLLKCQLPVQTLGWHQGLAYLGGGLPVSSECLSFAKERFLNSEAKYPSCNHQVDWVSHKEC
jgi:hypothetical protein